MGFIQVFEAKGRSKWEGACGRTGRESTTGADVRVGSRTLGSA